MGKPRRKEKSGTSTSKAKVVGGGDDGGDGGDGDEMLIDDPIQPRLYCHGRILFETKPTLDRSTPFQINYGTESNVQHLEVCESNVLNLAPPVGMRSNVDRKALHVIRYEYRLSEILPIVQITESERVGRIKSNLIRELIKGIMKEFCYLMKESPNDTLYLQHPENCMITGYDEYMSADGINNRHNLIANLDEFSTEIGVKFGWYKRTGGNQTTIGEKLRSLKTLLSQIIIEDVDKKDVDMEWTNFLDSLTEQKYEDAHKHAFLMHWDTKLDFVGYLHTQLNLNGGPIIVKAKQIFNSVQCLDRDWEHSLEASAPIWRISTAKLTVHHEEEGKDMLEDEDDSNQGTESLSLGGQDIKASDKYRNIGGVVALSGQGSSQVSQGKGKIATGKPRPLTQPEKILSLRRKKGFRFVKLIRNSNQHVTQVKWKENLGKYEYVNIDETDVEDDKLFKNRHHLYKIVKQVLPEFWIETVPAARSHGFMKY